MVRHYDLGLVAIVIGEMDTISRVPIIWNIIWGIKRILSIILNG